MSQTGATWQGALSCCTKLTLGISLRAILIQIFRRSSSILR